MIKRPNDLIKAVVETYLLSDVKTYGRYNGQFEKMGEHRSFNFPALFWTLDLVPRTVSGNGAANVLCTAKIKLAVLSYAEEDRTIEEMDALIKKVVFYFRNQRAQPSEARGKSVSFKLMEMKDNSEYDNIYVFELDYLFNYRDVSQETVFAPVQFTPDFDIDKVFNL